MPAATPAAVITRPLSMKRRLVSTLASGSASASAWSALWCVVTSIPRKRPARA
jgi:hypothetical protein